MWSPLPTILHLKVIYAALFIGGSVAEVGLLGQSLRAGKESASATPNVLLWQLADGYGQAFWHLWHSARH